jgi:hypothetical protein
LHQVKPLFIPFLAEVNPFQAAGVDDWRVPGKYLVAVKMSQGDVVEGRMSNVA